MSWPISTNSRPLEKWYRPVLAHSEMRTFSATSATWPSGPSRAKLPWSPGIRATLIEPPPPERAARVGHRAALRRGWPAPARGPPRSPGRRPRPTGRAGEGGPAGEPQGPVVHVDLGVRLPEVELVVWHAVALHPVQRELP